MTQAEKINCFLLLSAFSYELGKIENIHRLCLSFLLLILFTMKRRRSIVRQGNSEMLSSAGYETQTS